MLLVEPPPTAYDLNFLVAGIPVRVSPTFWLMTIFMGLGAGDLPAVLIWVIAVFISIVVHELGHALTAQAYGAYPRIVLHQFGGLAMYQHARRTRWSDLLITAAGPAAGFALAGLVVLVLRLVGLKAPFLGWNLGGDELYENRNLFFLVHDLLYVNLMWGFLNLMPIFPLDGGQIARTLLIRLNPFEGWRYSLWLSIITASGLVLWSLQRASQGGGMFTVLFFGWLAYDNYQMLQQMNGRGRGW